MNVLKDFFYIKKFLKRYFNWKYCALLGFVLILLICVVLLYEFILPFFSSDNVCDEICRREDGFIFKMHKKRADLNNFNFNDFNYSESKENDSYRIIILGDSIIFGDGLPLKEIWSHKLERILKRKYSVEVLHWGQCGWSTLDQLNFLKQNFGTKENIFDADLLLISWFDNDPDMGNIDFHKYESLVSNPLFKIFNKIFPNLSTFFFNINGFWVYLTIINQLYSDENLCRYQAILHELKLLCQDKKTDLFFVMISYGDIISKYTLERIEKLLQKEAISYINLHPLVSDQIKGIPFKKLYANPVNSHPGSILTTLYARYGCAELVKRYGSKMKKYQIAETTVSNDPS